MYANNFRQTPYMYYRPNSSMASVVFPAMNQNDLPSGSSNADLTPIKYCISGIVDSCSKWENEKITVEYDNVGSYSIMNQSRHNNPSRFLQG